jgi:hypothetical protein
MEQHKVPTEYKTAVARIYERVKCAVRMKGQQSNFFSSDIGVKQGCPLSPTRFGLCIDELEEMMRQFATDEGIEAPVIAQATILLLIYANDVVLASRTEAGTNKLMTALENFCELSDLSVNIDKTKVMLSKTKGKKEKIQPEITYKG